MSQHSGSDMIGGFYVKCVGAWCAFFKVFSHLLLDRVAHTRKINETCVLISQQEIMWALYDAINEHLITKRGPKSAPMSLTFSKCLINPSHRFQGDFPVCFNHKTCGKGDILEESHCFNMETLSSSIFQVWQPPWIEVRPRPAESLLLISVCLFNLRFSLLRTHVYGNPQSYVSITPSLLSAALFILDFFSSFFSGKTCSEMKIKVALHS